MSDINTFQIDCIDGLQTVDIRQCSLQKYIKYTYA